MVNAPVCKTGTRRVNIAGSNPALPTQLNMVRGAAWCGHLPVTQEIRWVQSPYGSFVALTAIYIGMTVNHKEYKRHVYSRIAQSVERSAVNRMVAGSSPVPRVDVLPKARNPV